MQPAMHLYITHSLYFEIYTEPLEGIQLMSIAGSEAFVSVSFMYKSLCAALHMAAVGCPYLFFYCVKKCIHKLQKSTRTRTKNIFKNEQKVEMLLQKEQIQEE